MFLICVLNIENLKAQDVKIQEIKLSDSLIEHTISSYINTRKREFSKFIEKGYVVTTLNYYNKNAKGNELLYTFSINDQYVELKNECIVLPYLFTHIEDKIVIIRSEIPFVFRSTQVSEKFKNQFLNIVNKSLGEKEALIVYNSKGEKVIDDNDFYPDESYNIHGGALIEIYADNTYNIKAK